jgi:hypothetical protein
VCAAFVVAGAGLVSASEGEWNEDGGHATCYVITTKGTADKS